MSRPPEEERVRTAVAEDLAEARGSDAGALPITVKAVAKRLGISRTTLYKYGLQQVIERAARDREASATDTPAAAERRAYSARLMALQEQCRLLQEQNRGLVAQIQIIEGNMGRLGLDPEELYRPLVKPLRHRSRAGGGRGGREAPHKRRFYYPRETTCVFAWAGRRENNRARLLWG